MQFRCSSKLHCIVDEETVEVRCSSRWCGKRKGVVIVHRFDLKTGNLISTRKFKDPKEQSSVRSSNLVP